MKREEAIDLYKKTQEPAESGAWVSWVYVE